MIDNIREYAGEKRLKDVKVGASKYQAWKFRVQKKIARLVIWTVRLVKKVMIILTSVSAVSLVVYMICIMYSFYHPYTVHAEPTIITVPDTSIAPVLKRIAQCENSGSQYAKNGQIGYHINTNGTIDIGKYEINSSWFSTATKLGFDLSKPQDNEAFAQYLYKNYGTSPWSASQSCWNK